MRNHHKTESLGKALLREFPFVILLSAITGVLHYAGCFKSLETAALDTFLSLNKPVEPQYVVLVAINDNDYKKQFNATSPLNHEKLLALIGAIAAGKPSLIAVDIDTSDDSWKDSKLSSSLPKNIPIVWAQGIERLKRELKPLPALGGVQPQTLAGIAALPMDWDGVIRRYRPSFKTVDGAAASFPAAIKSAFQALNAHGHLVANLVSKEKSKDQTLNFSAVRFDFESIYYEPLSATAIFDATKEQLDFKGKIVILGGEYRAGRDVFRTPLGETSGLRLMAYTVECILQNKAIDNTNEIIMFLMDLLIGTGVVILHHCLSVRLSFWLTLLAVPFVTIISSYIAFTSVAYWANFVPMVFGMLIEQLYGHVKKYNKMCKDLELLNARSVFADHGGRRP